MHNKKLDTELTPAARQALDELVQDYRDQILLAAGRAASSPAGEITEISVRDILDAVSAPESRRPPLPVRRKIFADILRAYAIGGVAIAVLGLGFLLLKDVAYRLDPTGRQVLYLSIAGLLLAFVSYMLLGVQASRGQHRSKAWTMPDQRIADLSVQYLRKWQQIELAARNHVATAQGESSARVPLSVLIARLSAAQVLTPQDVERLRSLTTMRNGIVHQAMEPDRSRLETAITEADEILAKIQSKD